MITKREVEMAEEIIERMSENQYSGLLGWLADGCKNLCGTTCSLGGIEPSPTAPLSLAVRQVRPNIKTSASAIKLKCCGRTCLTEQAAAPQERPTVHVSEGNLRQRPRCLRG
jgi:hypothetical protein